MANEWVDAIVFGPGDLAASMGFHGEWQHPEVLAAMEGVIDIALSRDIAVEAAEFSDDHANYLEQRERGIQIFGPTRTSEYNLLREAAARAIEPYR